MNKIIAGVLAASATLWVGAAAAAQRTVTLDIPNASCELCAPIVKKALSRVSGVGSVKVVDGANGAVATVTFDDTKTSLDAVIAASTNAGYPARVTN